MIGQGVERYGKNIFQSLQLIKKISYEFNSCLGVRGSEVQMLSFRPINSMGYGLFRSPFLVWGGIREILFINEIK